MKSLPPESSFLRQLFFPVLLVAVILAIYSPAITSGIHSIDDPGILAHFSSHLDVLNILTPGHTYYYRPVIELSYYLDSKLWGMEPSVMHLENILLHVINVLLVFFICRKVAAHYPERSRYIPVLAALLFALHPLNVEAISWIAGRTDPLASLFVLSACNYWLCWLENKKFHYVSWTFFFFVLALLTKETALAFLPVFVLITLVWPGVSPQKKINVLVGIGFSCVAVVALIILIYKSSLVSFGRFFSGFEIGNATLTAIIAFGFYVKKLLLPLPLNFAITEVNPMYGLFGLLALVAIATGVIKRRFTSLFFVISAIMVMPALLAAVKQIAWTPFAERYMYLPTAFLCIGTCSLLNSLSLKVLNFVLPFSLIFICIFGGISYQRSLLWKDKRSFFQDAVAKSPGFGSVYNELGTIYLQERQITLAAESFVVADRLNNRPSMKMLIKSNVMATIIAQGNLAEAKKYFNTLFADKNSASVTFLELLYTADSKRIETLNMGEKVVLAHDLLETLGLLYQKSHDPFWLYRSGQFALVTGDKVDAAKFFHKAYRDAPKDAHYKGAAKTYFTRLEVEK